LLAYCRRVLFDPMGFGPADWARGRDGEFRAASGLRLLPRDFLKIPWPADKVERWPIDRLSPR
jgi:hypothetical protein